MPFGQIGIGLQGPVETFDGAAVLKRAVQDQPQVVLRDDRAWISSDGVPPQRFLVHKDRQVLPAEKAEGNQCGTGDGESESRRLQDAGDGHDREGDNPDAGQILKMIRDETVAVEILVEEPQYGRERDSKIAERETGRAAGPSASELPEDDTNDRHASQ